MNSPAVPVIPGAKGRRWFLLCVTLLLLVVTLRAGFWQLQRAADREAAQRSIEERAQRAPLRNAELLLRVAAGTALPDDLRDAPVRLEGHWKAEHTVWLDNRSMDGQAGFHVVTPLVLRQAAGSGGDVWVWVQRGWVARDVRDRTRLPELPRLPDAVEIAGRLAPGLSARFAMGQEERGAIRQNLTLAQMQAVSAGRSLPLVVIQTDAAGDGLLRNWPSPASGADKNRAYAAQWFGMAILIAGLYVWFQVIQPRRR